jgi:hypothetical protein
MKYEGIFYIMFWILSTAKASKIQVVDDYAGIVS